MIAKLNTAFYAALTVSFVLFLLPSEYKMGVYTPNYLGWFFVFGCLPITFLISLWLNVINIQTKDWKTLIIRNAVFLLVIIISTAYWFYGFYQNILTN